MPFKSEAQRRKFYAMADRGEISDETVDEWESKTKDKDLPERVEKKDEKKEKKAALARILKVANVMLDTRHQARKERLLPVLMQKTAIMRTALKAVGRAAAKKKPMAFGESAEQLGLSVGDILGMRGKGGYLTRRGAKAGLREAGEKAKGKKLKKLLMEELARRRRMVGYGALGTGGTGVGLLGYMLGSSGAPSQPYPDYYPSM